MQSFCTIVTNAYIPFAKVLYQSLRKYDPGISLQVLVTDRTTAVSEDNFFIHITDDLKGHSVFNELEEKYAHTHKDRFRWALKPVFISYLLEKGFEKLIYTDPDIFFFHDYRFLFDELDKTSVLLCPHWRDMDPIKNEENFIALFKDGLYNAGFIAVSSKGLEAMTWWAGLCEYKMDRQTELGIYDDQRYLDAMPLKFPGTTILQHQGCNIAKWNYNVCSRENKDGKLFINGKYPVIFIHFTKETIQEIINGSDKLLQPLLDEYKEALKKAEISFEGILDEENKNSIQLLKEKTLVRTRIKRFFYRLAEKL